jgi:hypothetical protein
VWEVEVKKWLQVCLHVGGNCVLRQNDNGEETLALQNSGITLLYFTAFQTTDQRTAFHIYITSRLAELIFYLDIVAICLNMRHILWDEQCPK